MRLIDADALKDRLQNLAYDDWNQGICTSWADAYRECADMVDEQPTIEPKRKTGQWLDNYQYGYKCSECGAYLEIDCGDVEMNFCPNCGAEMEKMEGSE